MPRKFYKFKLLLDEGFYTRRKLPRLNHRFNVKHITADLHHKSLPDEKVYELALKLKRLIVTFNKKDFIVFAKESKQSGIIGVSPNLPVEQIDKKITSLLMKSTPKALYGKFTSVSEETEV